MLQTVANSLWVSTTPLRFFGTSIGTRMTIIRLQNGELFLHSPVELTHTLCQELNELGPVRFLIAPNRFHHMFLAPYLERYPQAKAYAAPGLPEKRKDITFYKVLENDLREEAWFSEIESMFFPVFPILNEVVFFHKPSRTLLLTDLVFNIHHTDSWFTKLVLSLIGQYGRMGPMFEIRLFLSRKQKKLGVQLITRILEWDFDRIIMAHGEIVETHGKELFQRAYSFLLR